MELPSVAEKPIVLLTLRVFPLAMPMLAVDPAELTLTLLNVVAPTLLATVMLLKLIFEIVLL
jgi:hypothetical protein